MGTNLTLKASDGHSLSAYRADPVGTPRAAVVVVQEIFGVNHHIRSICDRLAAEGYVAIAPALFDRIEPNFQSGYSPEEVEVARGFIPKVDWAKVMLDMAVTVDEAAHVGKVGVIGFCLGGSVAYLAGVRLPVQTAICCYGGQIVKHADNAPKCPTQMHFGDKDHGIPLTDVEQIKAKRPECEVNIYAAGHGFICDERASYDETSAKLAWSRSIDFLRKHLG